MFIPVGYLQTSTVCLSWLVLPQMVEPEMKAKEPHAQGILQDSAPYPSGQLEYQLTEEDELAVEARNSEEIETSLGASNC